MMRRSTLEKSIVFRVSFLWIPAFGTLAAAAMGNGCVLILLRLVLMAADWRRA